jgi:hypothetical protein
MVGNGGHNDFDYKLSAKTAQTNHRKPANIKADDIEFGIVGRPKLKRVGFPGSILLCQLLMAGLGRLDYA